jgi:catechol 2,3-dioxygenase-like lactoylglutathione lyase family enzyme
VGPRPALGRAGAYLSRRGVASIRVSVQTEPRVQAALDHAMLMVRDLRAASDDFARLGFRVVGGGRHPAGIENRIIPFGPRGPYVELVSIYKHGDVAIRDNEEFLAQGEGVIYVGLRVASATRTAGQLRELGLKVQGPYPGTIQRLGGMENPPVLWHSMTIAHPGSDRADPLFFTEYSEEGRAIVRAHDPEWARRYDEEREVPHPNAATWFASVWIAVHRIKEVAERYGRLGFARAREFEIAELEARAAELRLDSGSMWIVESSSANGPMAQLLAVRGFGVEVPGISLEVPDLRVALGAMRPETARLLEVSDLPSGRGVLIPPALAHGLWIELFQKPGAGG